jgi:hypothetical protein
MSTPRRPARALLAAALLLAAATARPASGRACPDPPATGPRGGGGVRPTPAAGPDLPCRRRAIQ